MGVRSRSLATKLSHDASTCCRFCIHSGNNLQALGMTQLELKERDRATKDVNEHYDDGMREELDSCESPIWIFGTTVFLTGSVLNFVAFAFAPQSILASLEGIQVRAAKRGQHHPLYSPDTAPLHPPLTHVSRLCAMPSFTAHPPCPSSSRTCSLGGSCSGPTSRR